MSTHGLAAIIMMVSEININVDVLIMVIFISQSSERCIIMNSLKNNKIKRKKNRFLHVNENLNDDYPRR